MDLGNFKLVGERLLIKKLEKKDSLRKQGFIYVEDDLQQEGVIAAIGCPLNGSEENRLGHFKLGQRVLLDHYLGAKIILGGEDYFYCDPESVIGIIGENA